MENFLPYPPILQGKELKAKLTLLDLWIEDILLRKTEIFRKFPKLNDHRLKPMGLKRTESPTKAKAC